MSGGGQSGMSAGHMSGHVRPVVARSFSLHVQLNVMGEGVKHISSMVRFAIFSS